MNNQRTQHRKELDFWDAIRHLKSERALSLAKIEERTGGSLDHLRQLGLNERPLTPQDANLICESENIRVYYEPTIWHGVYFMYGGQPRVFINSSLSQIEQLITLWHEIAHHMLHAHQVKQASADIQMSPRDRNESKTEFEAQAIASIALIPLPLLLSAPVRELQEKHRMPAGLVMFRKQLYERLHF